jgi:hypothetical protein
MHPETPLPLRRSRVFSRAVLLLLVVAGIAECVYALRKAARPAPAPPAAKPAEAAASPGPKASSLRNQFVDDHWSVGESKKVDGWRISTYKGHFGSVLVVATLVSHGCRIGMLSYTLSWDAADPHEGYRMALDYVCGSLFELSMEAGEASERVMMWANSRSHAADAVPGEPAKEEMTTPDGWIVRGTAIPLEGNRVLTSIAALRPDLPELTVPPGTMK